MYDLWLHRILLSSPCICKFHDCLLYVAYKTNLLTFLLLIDWWLIDDWLIDDWLIDDWLIDDWLIDDWLWIDWLMIDWLMIDCLMIDWLMIDWAHVCCDTSCDCRKASICSYMWVQVRYLEERQTFAPEQVTAMMLTKLKEIAEAYLKTKVVDCVISVCLTQSQVSCLYCCRICFSLHCWMHNNDVI